jgi:hypothetical protein
LAAGRGNGNWRHYAVERSRFNESEASISTRGSSMLMRNEQRVLLRCAAGEIRSAALWEEFTRSAVGWTRVQHTLGDLAQETNKKRAAAEAS